MLQMAENGAYNINLVSPTPYALEIAKALDGARRQGLSIPVVYNTGGYDSLSTLSMLDGLIDIYLPDAKIAAHPSQKEGEPDQRSMRLCGAGDYPWVNRKAVLEMLRQVGHIKLDDNGLAKRGLFLRHLVLPDNLARTSHLLPWLADNLGPSLYLSLMAQYHPSHLIKIGDNPEFRDLPGLGRPLSVREYDDCKQIAWNHGLNNTFVQDLESAFSYRPDFTKPKVFS
jgi:putative pyruvate formate lyase activating enzyme